jgi:predicted AlkP superfamily phosphohydrolase/phosphomutase
MHEPLLVIGLDGVGYPFLKELLDAGELPNLSKIVDRGSFKPLRSVEIPLTPIAWSTSYTGVKPDRHGICGFVRRVKGSYAWTYTGAAERAAPDVWKILSDQGFRSVLVGPIFCQAVRDIDGVFVGGEFCGERGSVYPKHLEPTVRQDFDYKPSSPCRTSEEATAYIKTKFDLAKHLLETNAWDLAFLGFFETDVVHHRNDPKLILDVYRSLDTLLGEFLSQMPSNVSCILYSDHGNRLYRKAFHVNSWLYSTGFLAVHPFRTRCRQWLRELRAELAGLRASRRSPVMFAYGAAWHLGRRLVRNCSPLFRMFMKAFPNAKIPESARPMNKPDVSDDVTTTGFDLTRHIDFRNTAAFASMIRGGNIGGICINRRGVDPAGLVEAEDYETVQGDIAEQLRRLRDRETGRPVVKRVWNRQEIFTDAFAGDFPDVIFELDDHFCYISEDNISKGNVTFGFDTVQHSMDGVMLSWGPKFSASVSEDEDCGALLDIAPTILYALNAGIPSHMQGRAMHEVFTDSFLENHTMNISEIPDPTIGDGPQAEPWTPDEQQKLDTRLRELGYL